MGLKDGMGVNKATELHDIPKTTLKDRANGHIVHGSKSDQNPRYKLWLPSQEETQLTKYRRTGFDCIVK